MISAKIVSVLILAATLTAWRLLLEPMYEEWVLSQGWVMGIGETFLGYIAVGSSTFIITWFLLRRLRQVE